MPFAGQWNKDMTTFMDQQLAVDALVALPSEPPYPFAALATIRSLKARVNIINSIISSLLWASSYLAVRIHPTRTHPHHPQEILDNNSLQISRVSQITKDYASYLEDYIELNSKNQC